jgi:hypothetical protein
MNLVEIFLPLADNEGVRFSQSAFDTVEHQLAERFGGVTTYPRATASGLWKTPRSEKQEDEFLVYEVMTASLDEAWWKNYHENLETSFRQEQVIVRTHDIKLL